MFLLARVCIVETDVDLSSHKLYWCDIGRTPNRTLSFNDILRNLIN